MPNCLFRAPSVVVYTKPHGVDLLPPELAISTLELVQGPKLNKLVSGCMPYESLDLFYCSTYVHTRCKSDHTTVSTPIDEFNWISFGFVLGNIVQGVTDLIDETRMQCILLLKYSTVLMY